MKTRLLIAIPVLGLLSAAFGYKFWPGVNRQIEKSETVVNISEEIYSRFDARYPGRGTTDYPGNTIEDVPKAYAMVLLGELERRRHGIYPHLPNLAVASGSWLLDNARLDRQGRTGWGVPVGWDAYGDGSINPENTIYSISTAIVVDALLSWMETVPDAPGEKIRATVEKALVEFSEMRTPSGLLPYSLEVQDFKYDTYNSAAYLAGQMQRFAKYASTGELSNKFRSAADSTVKSLLQNQLRSSSGAWYWTYSLQEKVSNDLPHASYIVEGLRTYVREAGTLSTEIDLQAVMLHVRDFSYDGQTVRGWPDFERSIDYPARLYDLGMAMALTCGDVRLSDMSSYLERSVLYYRSHQGYTKYPDRTKVGSSASWTKIEPLVVKEYEAYAWRGLVACEVQKQSAPTSGFTRVHNRGLWPAAPIKNEVSFTNGVSKQGTRFSWKGPNGVELFSEDYPIWREEDADGQAVILRRPLANQLRVGIYDRKGAMSSSIEISHTPASAIELRAAKLVRDDLFIIYYDNPTLKNYVVRLNRLSTEVSSPLELPSLEDPAGATYEMIPKIHILGLSDGIHVVGGTLDAFFTKDMRISVRRIENCSRVIEAIAVSSGVVSLCAQKEPSGPGAPFQLIGPNDILLPKLDQTGIPYDLREGPSGIAITMAASPVDLARMLNFDLERLNSGWLEYGIDNTEGRIPWSQIYYLNGFLDFFINSRLDAGADWQPFKEILDGMRLRLDEEIALLDRQWTEGRFKTRAFSVDRSEQLFAVQTSRLYMLLNRYTAELVDPVNLIGINGLRQRVMSLADHIEVMKTEGQPAWWIPKGSPYLAWPKGSSFYFDGLNVPFNHQNEWAYAIALDNKDSARAIVSHFLRRIAPDGVLPLTGVWPYWWGTAYDGWSASEGVSVNKPSYKGDHIAAWISFRSIDVMATLHVTRLFDSHTYEKLIPSVMKLLSEGKLYPFVAYELYNGGVQLSLPVKVARAYARVSSPWELQNAAWAYGTLTNQVK